MFRPGQTVYQKTGKLSGKVLEVDGDTVYLLQPNGVEIELRLAELTTTPPPTKTPEAETAARLTRVLTDADIAPEHKKVLETVPKRTLQTVAAMYEKRPGAGRFSALSVARKINYITEVTGVPYRTMKEYSDRPGEMGLLMGRGLSVRAGS
jgi:hypothetical protein